LGSPKTLKNKILKARIKASKEKDKRNFAIYYYKIKTWLNLLKTVNILAKLSHEFEKYGF